MFQMTEFEKFMEKHGSDLNPGDREFAEKVWHAAQRAAWRAINSPPCIPAPGDKVRFLGLCHPRLLGQVREVREVTKETLEVYFVCTKETLHGEEVSTTGILSEVEIIADELNINQFLESP